MVPENLLKMYPADVIRYWTASASLGTDTAFADTQLKLGGRTSTKLWNAFLFIKEHGHFEGMKDLSPRHPLNRWVLHEASKSFDRYLRGFTENEFSIALEAVERYFWSVLCDQYLELVKDQFFNPTSYDAALVEETKKTLALVGMRILQMFAPFMPHMTEIMYQELYRSVLQVPSLHMTQFSDIQKEHRDESIEETITVLLNVVNQVRKLKTTQQLSLKTDITQLTIGPSNKVESHLKPLEQIMKGVTRAQTIVYGVPSISELILVEEGKYAAAVNTDQEQTA
jgi:valyl-tRNA synthetase